MEEFERLEIELKSLFDQYIVRVRCLDALRAQLAARIRLPNQHQFIIAQTTDTSMPFIPDELIDSDEDASVNGNDDEDRRLPVNRRRNQQQSIDEMNAMTEAGQMIRDSRRVATGNRLRVRTAANRGGGGVTGNNGERRFVGNMMGGSDMDSSLETDEDEESEESEGGLMSHGLMHTDEDDEDDVDKLRVAAGEKLTGKGSVFSDEDF